MLTDRTNKSGITIINKTPHPIHLILNKDTKSETSLVFDKCDNPIRLYETDVVVDGFFANDVYIEIKHKQYSQADLPDIKVNTFYIVSAMVANKFPTRSDLLIVNDTVRDENGRIIGCESFAIASKPSS